MKTREMKPILITIDVEECDIPLEYGFSIPLEEQLAISREGLAYFMQLMEEAGVPVTILNPMHELASHGYFHGHFEASKDLKNSKDLLEKLSGKSVTGFRMARMQYVDESEILKAGYAYHSSLNPTWIPGRYDHRDKPTKPFFEKGLWNVPASVSPWLRIPLFWLAYKNFPLWIYTLLAKRTLRKQGFLNIYFHPWEFADLSKYPLPIHVKRGHNGPLRNKLRSFLQQMKGEGKFTTMAKMLENNE
jgi:peptidoglycan/xylan/chitin deacetylase (PgdA/CDA1 family)